MEKEPFVPKSHIKLRNTFRVIGILTLTAGIIMLIKGFVDFSKPFDPFTGAQDTFSLIPISFIFLFIGAILTSLGFNGALARYGSREQTPVISDSINYIATETKENISQIIQPAASSSTLVQAKQCPSCSELNQVHAKFCNECGHSL